MAAVIGLERVWTTEAKLPASTVSTPFGRWFSGFFDGEGSFLLWTRDRRSREGQIYHERVLGISIGLREDDSHVLRYVQSIMGGRLTHCPARGTTRPSIKWSMAPTKELAEIIVPLLRQFPLKSKKSTEFSLWYPLVLWRYSLSRGGSTHPRRLPQAYHQAFELAERMVRDLREPS